MSSTGFYGEDGLMYAFTLLEVAIRARGRRPRIEVVQRPLTEVEQWNADVEARKAAKKNRKERP